MFSDLPKLRVFILFLTFVLIDADAHPSKNQLKAPLPFLRKKEMPPSFMENEEDIPTDRESLPKEIIDRLEPEESIDEIVVEEEGRKQIINLNENSHQEEAILVPVGSLEEEKLIKELLKETKGNINSEERPRSSPFDTSSEEDYKSQMANDSSREELMKLLEDARNIQRSVPSNRGKSSTHNRSARQVNITLVDDDQLPGEDQGDGTRCLKKIFQRNETEYERGMRCQHVLKDKCHMTYATDYHPKAQEKCETIFKKRCHITFKAVPHTETFERCHTPFEKKCGEQVVGPKVCKTVLEDVCETLFKSYEVQEQVPDCTIVETNRCILKPVEILHLPSEEGKNQTFATKEICEVLPIRKCNVKTETVKKVHPVTECKKVPKEFCKNEECVTVVGQKVCSDEQRTVVQNIPEEDCDMEPHKHCQMETTLVPKLVPKKNCVKVGKDVCVNTKKNPTKKPKFFIKNWCYNVADLKKSISDK